MSVVESPKAGGLVQRAQNILMRPAAEWDVIEGEPATIASLYTGYACILAAIPAVAMVLGSLLISHWMVIGAVLIGVLTYVGQLIGLFILHLIIDALAPSFDGQKNAVQAMKLAVYPYTAVWVAGVLNIIPFLGIIASLAGLYGLYILYLGLPKLMKVPQEKVVGYFVVTLVVAIVVNIVISMIIGAVTAAVVIGGIATGAAALGGLHGY